jgi:hypothetical protein
MMFIKAPKVEFQQKVAVKAREKAASHERNEYSNGRKKSTEKE